MYNFKKKVWNKLEIKAVENKDKLPKIDSHSMVVDKKEKKIYILFGFLTNGGVYTNSVYMIDIRKFESKLISTS